VGQNSIGVDKALAGYGEREATRYQHSVALQQLYGYRPFEGVVRKDTLTWLRAAAERALASAVWSKGSRSAAVFVSMADHRFGWISAM
jgi:Domain of unknown function (DUF4158)